MKAMPRWHIIHRDQDGSFVRKEQDLKIHGTRATTLNYVRMWDKDKGWLVAADIRMSDGTRAFVEGKGTELPEALKSFWADYYSFAPRTEWLELPGGARSESR